MTQPVGGKRPALGSSRPPLPFRTLDKPKTTRPSTTSIGARAEAIAATYLLKQGFELLGRNVHVGRVEIDLLVRDGPVIAIVEVRTRGPRSFQRPLDSIGTAKRTRLRRAAEQLWRMRFSKDTTVERIRFDAVSVTFSAGSEPLVEHVRAAF